MTDSPDEREISQEELDAYAAQTDSLNQLTEVAMAQFDLSQEQMDRYLAAFQDPNNLANDDLAEFQSLITGQNVSASDLEGMGLEDIIRESMLQAPAQFQREAENFVNTTNDLATQFNVDTSFNTEQLVGSLNEAGYNYQTELAQTKEQMGTIDKDILSRETGAATAGISSAFKEGRKGLDANLAQRGLSNSGLDAQAQMQLSQQESLAKFGALSQARNQSRGLSDQLRMQRLGISGQQFGQAQQQAQNIYGAQQGLAQSQYGVGSQQAGNVLNTRTSATQQGLSTLQQAQAGAQGQYFSNANMLGQAGSSFGAAASGYGQQGSAYMQSSMNQYNQQIGQAGATNQAIGSIAGMGLGGFLGNSGLFG